jgi:hypothetical protein
MFKYNFFRKGAQGVGTALAVGGSATVAAVVKEEEKATLLEKHPGRELELVYVSRPRGGYSKWALKPLPEAPASELEPASINNCI